MIVVADTGPLRYLIEVNAIAALPRLFGRVLTTPQVAVELALPSFPQSVRDWIARAPAWLYLESAADQLFFGLHVGEASALSLAVSSARRIWY